MTFQELLSTRRVVNLSIKCEHWLYTVSG